MTIKTRVTNGVTILDISGKITIGEGSSEIRNTVRELLEAGRKNILLNLGGVTYCDSAGIGELVSSFTTVNRANGKLKLENLTDKLNNLLAITKLLTVFECFNDEKEAIASFSSPKS